MPRPRRNKITSARPTVPTAQAAQSNNAPAAKLSNAPQQVHDGASDSAPRPNLHSREESTRGGPIDLVDNEELEPDESPGENDEWMLRRNIPSAIASSVSLAHGKNPKWPSPVIAATLYDDDEPEEYVMSGALGGASAKAVPPVEALSQEESVVPTSEDVLQIDEVDPMTLPESGKLKRAKRRVAKEQRAQEAAERKSARRTSTRGILDVDNVEMSHQISRKASSIRTTATTRQRVSSLLSRTKEKISRALSPKSKSPSQFEDLEAGRNSLDGQVEMATEVEPVRRAPATPSALFANFKQRPRQPSILHMVQQEDAGNDSPLGSGDSILQGLQQSSPNGSDHTMTNAARTTSSRKRKASSMEELLPSSPLTAIVARDDDAEIEESPPMPPRRSSHRAPSGSKAIQQAEKAKAEKATSPTFVATSPLSSPQSSQLAPQSPVRGQRKEHPQKRVDLKTASLQALLPKRMKSAQDAYTSTDIFDISAVGQHDLDGAQDEKEEEDDDELSRPIRKGGAAKKPSKKARSLVKTVPNPRGRQPLHKSPAKITNAGAKAPTGKSKKTYSRRHAEDIENASDEQGIDVDEVTISHDDDESIAVGKPAPARKGRLSEELVRAKEKFQEVDQWALSFESCDVGGGSSSPWR